jgi:hypothetical protein
MQPLLHPSSDCTAGASFVCACHACCMPVHVLLVYAVVVCVRRLSSLSVGIIFIAYALQVKYQPFLPPNSDMLGDKAAVASSGMQLVYVRGLYSSPASQYLKRCLPSCNPQRLSLQALLRLCVCECVHFKRCLCLHAHVSMHVLGFVRLRALLAMCVCACACLCVLVHARRDSTTMRWRRCTWSRPCSFCWRAWRSRAA